MLDKAYKAKHHGELPELDQLDALKPRSSSLFTAVGCGLQKAFPDAACFPTRPPGRSRPTACGCSRDRTSSRSTPDSPATARSCCPNNANTGGTCFGDSGGSNFVGDANVVGGVTSFRVNGTCGGTGGAYRVDRADDLGWLYGTLGAYLP